MERGDPEGALFQICAAIETTATKEYGREGRKSYKSFVHDNLALITRVSFGGLSILNLNLRFSHPRITTTPDGLVPLQEILYHAVRCGLYHDSRLPDDLAFSGEGQIRIEEDGKVVLPPSLIYGLIVAVVTSPSNEHEQSHKQHMLKIRQLQIPLETLWGQRKEIARLLDAVNEKNRRIERDSSET